VGGVAGAAEHGGAHAHEQGLLRNFPHELRVGLVVLFQGHGQVFFIGFELVDALQIVVAPVNETINKKIGLV